MMMMIINSYCKIHYYCTPFNYALGDENVYITGVDIHSK